ncbi:MAG: IS21 family transposase [Bacillota bacterium]|nr:IS21 family transposase [Bacillota bacterium]
MLRWDMYSEIHQLKAIGLKKAQVAKRLEIDVKTVTKYWEVSAEQFHQIMQASGSRTKKLKCYRDIILKWLKENPDLSAAQILDWLKEHYADFSVRERTLRRYVDELRKKHNLPKPAPVRQYQAVSELPPGRQMQLDFGQKRICKAGGGYITLYVMGVVLAHSRYKCGKWTDKPLTTAAFIQMLLFCFEHLEGLCEELVIDQDKLAVVSENGGDIIYTYEFEKFKQQMGFSVYLCRKGDPESKGKIEAVVKYIKRNFAANRFFTDIRSWNESFYDWLKRTGNYNVHGTTKKIPAEVFLSEQKHLKPVPWINVPKEILTRTVRKDNTILHRGNRYTVPIGTYRPGCELKLEETGHTIKLFDQQTGALLAEHSISLEKGQLIQNSNHLRDHRVKAEQLFEKTLNMLGNCPETKAMLEGIRHEKPRYVREQYLILQKMTALFPEEVTLEAINYCLEHQLYCAADCHDIAGWLEQEKYVEKNLTVKASMPEWLKIKTEKRDPVSAYLHLVGGEGR